MARFLDIASYQNVTDAPAVAATDVDGVWVKLTGEMGYENPRRFQQLDSLRGAGLGVGGYHFGDPRVDYVGQARHFGADAQARGVLAEGSLFPMFDAENTVGITWTATSLNACILVWRDVLRAEFGVVDFLVYGSESWWRNGMIDPRVWGDEHAWNWIANYNGRPGSLTLGWSHPQDALHQWRSDAVPFPGIVASGLDDNTPLRGHTRESLTIGKAGGWLMTLSSAEQQEILDKTRMIYTAIWGPSTEAPTVGGGPGTPETIQDTVQRVATRQQAHIDFDHLNANSIAAIETVVNRIDQREAGAGMTEAERDQLASDIADQVDASQQQIVNALRSVTGTITYAPRPTGG